MSSKVCNSAYFYAQNANEYAYSTRQVNLLSAEWGYLSAIVLLIRQVALSCESILMLGGVIQSYSELLKGKGLVGQVGIGRGRAPHE